MTFFSFSYSKILLYLPVLSWFWPYDVQFCICWQPALPFSSSRIKVPSTRFDRSLFVVSLSALTKDYINYRQKSNSFRRETIPGFPLFVSIPDQDDIVDVEFESVVPSKKNKQKNSKSKEENKNKDTNEDDFTSSLFEKSKNLIDISFETSDQAWKHLRIPFCRGDEYIDGRLAFVIELEGQSYGIAVPFDNAVAIICQEKVTDYTNKNHPKTILRTTNISPESYETNEDYAELMEIFAAQVQQQMGEEFHLRKTPKVLTISGDLDKVTKDWEKTVIKEPVRVEDLLDSINDKDEKAMEKELQEFYDFMRKQLGDEEFEKTMNSDDEQLSDMDQELIKFFDISGLETQKNDNKELEELIQSISDDLKHEEVIEARNFVPDVENSSLKLVGYTFRDSGKSYYLVKPFQPIVLVGRHLKDEEDIIRFELLSSEEERVIVPKLEEMCKEDLEAKGLKFETP